jgi:hypothetical protein
MKFLIMQVSRTPCYFLPLWLIKTIIKIIYAYPYAYIYTHTRTHKQVDIFTLIVFWKTNGIITVSEMNNNNYFQNLIFA